MAKGKHYDTIFLENQLEQFRAVLIAEGEKLGTLCLSSKNDDILMWAHYTDGHKGICLEFDKSILSHSFQVDKVKYRKKYPSFRDFLGLPIGGKTPLLLLTKSDHWKYESEWRAIIDVANDDKIKSFPPEMLTGVISGCQIPYNNRRAVQSWAEKHATPVNTYMAVKKKNKYELDIMGLK